MSTNYLAFDVGGTSIKYAVINQQWQILTTGKRPTKHNHDQTIIKTLQQVSTDVMNQYDLSGIGVSTAGRVGPHGDIIYAGPTISDYQGTPIQHVLQQQTGSPVYVMNDVDAALMGEIRRGNYDLHQSIYCVALGTGIGGAFYDGEHLLQGAHGLANSVGYLNYDPQSQMTFESHSSTLALEHQLKSFNVTVPQAFEKARQGDEHFQQIITDWCQEIGKHLATICLLLDPAIIIIGGAVSQQGDFFINQLQAAVEHHLPAGMANVKIQAPMLKEQAQLFGAISQFFVWKRIHKSDFMLLLAL